MKIVYFFIISILLIISVSQNKPYIKEEIDLLQENLISILKTEGTTTIPEQNITITSGIWQVVAKKKLRSVTSPSDNVNILDVDCNEQAVGCYFVISVNGGEPKRYNVTKQDFIEEMDKNKD